MSETTIGRSSFLIIIIQLSFVAGATVAIWLWPVLTRMVTLLAGEPWTLMSKSSLAGLPAGIMSQNL